MAFSFEYHSTEVALASDRGPESAERLKISVSRTRSLVLEQPVGSEFSLENEVFKPIFFLAGSGQTVGKFCFGWWENSAISLRPLPAPCVMCLFAGTCGFRFVWVCCCVV